ncbi:AAA domain-containing protein [Longispora sp. NPDC051575]|uniref:AAA domain-containing protein n=1 Tax=Longispora sp. NPDC051575 TaxID=3154943 RepID=UPI00343AC3CF
MDRRVKDRYALLGDTPRQGGRATVLKATDVQLLKHVAVKFIPRIPDDPLQELLFEREVKALQLLEHDHIVSLIDWGEDSDTGDFFVVLDWVDDLLMDVLPPVDDYGWDDFADLMLPVLDALAYAHRKNVVHRDVKPANILVGKDGSALLADFGISKIRGEIETTDATVVDLVSRPYAPPDKEGMSRASRDVWGFAVTALHCLTRVPMTDFPHIDEALELLNVPAAVEQVLRDCVSRDPKVRPTNAIALRALLREIQDPRSAKQFQARKAQLTVSPGAARILAAPPFDRDPEAVQRAIDTELERGAHLQRYRDPRTQRRSTDTLELIGESRILRLAIIGDDPVFRLTQVQEVDEGALDRRRRQAWPTRGRVQWVSTPLPPADAREAMELILGSLDEHYAEVIAAERVRDENRLFDKWSNLLRAKEEFERGKLPAMPYRRADVTGRQVRFTLEHAPDSDVVGQQLVCQLPSDKVVGGVGTVIAQDGELLTLAYERRPKALPTGGKLVLHIGPAETAFKRQHQALTDIRGGSAVRADLRELILNPTSVAVPIEPADLRWRNPRLDDDKKAAVAGALGAPDLFLLEGPPGTGKTTFITELVQQELDRNPGSRILLVSQTHVAVDNALTGLADAGVAGLVRLGQPDDPRIDPRSRDLLLDKQMPRWVREIRTKAERELALRAAEIGVEKRHVQAAALLSELRETLLVAARTQARLDVALAPRAAGLDAVSAAEESSEVATLNDRLDKALERARVLRQEAADALDEDLDLPETPTAQDAADAFDALIGRDDQLRHLADVLKIQGEWFQRIESTTELEGVFLRGAQVVAGTCLGFLSHPEVKNLQFDLCILDEASKATATETLVPLARARRWVLVGDPRQLPPTQEDVLGAPALMDKHHLERADVEHTLFQWFLDHVPGGVARKLTRQYRMRRGIGDLISACFYDGHLTSPVNPTLPGWDLLHRDVSWLDTSALRRHEEREVGTGRANQCEVQVIQDAVRTVRDRLERNLLRPDTSPLKLLVLTGYSAQKDQLSPALARLRSPSLDIEVATVDAVQGREADITIFSVVRSNRHGQLGFLGPLSWRRINVALSRSRYGLVIVGDATFCRAHEGPLQKVLEYMTAHPDTCTIEEAARG